MTDSRNVGSLLESWIERFLQDRSFDPFDELPEDHPERVHLEQRWRTLVESGLMHSEHGTWAIPPEALDAPWTGEEAPSEWSQEFGGRYRTKRRIGSGGMGVVYEAFDVELRRTVALKVLRLSHADSGGTRRFLDEARRTGALEHPFVVPLYDVGESDARELYYVMRYVPGQNLAQWHASEIARGHPPSAATVTRIIRAVAEAIAHSHRHGVIHRDLKPGNVLVGEGGEVLLADWGVSGLIRDEGAVPPNELAEVQVSELESASGTAHYMSPEQARSDRVNEGVWTDVFGIGALLHHLLTGAPPYTGDSETARMRAALGRRSEAPLAPWSRAMPKELRAIADQAMRLQPCERYASAAQLIEDVDAFVERRPGIAWSDGPIDRLRKGAERRPVIAVMAVALLVTAGLAWGLVQSNRLVVFAAEVNDRAQWIDDARLVIEQPRVGLTYPDAYHEAARRIQALLERRGLIVEEPEQCAKALRQLMVEDPECGELADVLVCELGLTLLRAGVGWPPKTDGLGPHEVRRLAWIAAATREHDPKLARLWEPWLVLREELLETDWDRKRWDTFVAFLRDGDQQRAIEGWQDLLANAVGRSWADVAGTVREASVFPATGLDGVLREVADAFPELSDVHMQLLSTARGTTTWRDASGKANAARDLRTALEIEALARATYAANPRSFETAREVAITRGGVVDAYLKAARELESLAPDAASEGGAGASSILTSMADGMRVAAVSWRLRQITHLRNVHVLFAGDGARFTVHIRAVASAHRELAQELPKGQESFLRSAFADRGLEAGGLESEFDKFKALIDDRYPDSDQAQSAVALAHADLDQLDEADAVLGRLEAQRDSSTYLLRAVIEVLLRRIEGGAWEHIDELERHMRTYEALDGEANEAVVLLRDTRERLARVRELR